MIVTNLRCLLVFRGVALFLLSSIVVSCQFFTGSNQPDEPIARVGESFLLKSELNDIVPNNVDSIDSIQISRNYISKWVEKQALLQKAELNLSSEQKDIERELEDYRHSLLVFRYQTEYVNQALDTQVTDAEVKKYYEEHPGNFQLKDFIVQADYMVVDKNAPKLGRVQRWFENHDEDDREKLIEYAVQFAREFHFDKEEWLYTDDVFKKIPVQTLNVENFLKQNTFVHTEDSAMHYFLYMHDYRLKDALAPLSLQRTFIRTIILNKRKLELINRMKKGILDEAEKNNKIEYYP